MTRAAVRRAIARLAPTRQTANGIRVLLYHSIDAPDNEDRLSLRVSRDNFLAQMTWLRERAYSVVPLRELLSATTNEAQPSVALTFDDGYRSLAWAFGILREFGFPGTVFVVPRLINGVRAPTAYWERWGHLDWDDLGRLVDSGIEIGAHSMTHPDLRRCTDDELEEEVAGAKALLETRLGGGVTSFSYPYGRYDKRVRLAVERAGYRLACTGRHGDNRNRGPSYLVRRTEIIGNDDLQHFQFKLQGKYDWLRYWQVISAGLMRSNDYHRPGAGGL